MKARFLLIFNDISFIFILMSETATLSTVIDARVKEAATEFCRRRGLKLRYLIEEALVEQIEDEIDLESYHQRRREQTIPLEKILAGRKRRPA